jgi:gas vesicle protein
MTFDREGLLELINLEQRRSTTNRILSSAGFFIGGSIIGAAVALLVTPKSGQELRGDLKNLSADLKQNTVDPIIDRLNGHVESTAGSSSEA